VGFDLIIPVSADRPEYEMRRPYWMDRHPGGNIMLYEAASGIDPGRFDRIWITLLKKHHTMFGLSEIIEEQFETAGLGDKVNIVLLDSPTRNQPETVALTIREGSINGAIVIKDADNRFVCDLSPGNFVCTFPLDALTKVNPGDKSYIAFDDNKFLTNIIEKKIISRWFCTGAYGFEESSSFLEYYDRISGNDRLYISHIIYSMLLDKIDFRPVGVSDYLDWGTEAEWEEFKSRNSR